MQMAEWNNSPTRKIEEWAVRVEEKLRNMEPLPTTEENLSRRERRCIYRVPANIVRKEQDDSHVYRPYRVSFGPYFHGDESCLPREQDKELVLLHYLRRSGLTLGDYLGALADLVDELKDAYDQLDPKWQDDTQSFLQMMILDGCFLLELLRAGIDSVRYYVSDNPIILRIQENPSELACYRHDMLLLENQLPMLLLQRLLTLERGSTLNFVSSQFEEDIAATFFSVRHISRRGTNFECLHILDACRKSLVYRLPFRGMIIFRRIRRPERRTRTRTRFHFNIPSATELHNAGIGFTTSETTISFGRRTLRLPQIVVDGATKSSFLNIIAFEQLHAGAGNEATSYIYFMRSLIQGANDVSLLQSRGIINTALTNGEVAELFYRLSKDILLDPDKSLPYEYLEVGRMLRESFNKMSNEWRKDLFQTYLRSPWTIISVIAAILLFTLSIIQTVYTVLSYVNRK